MLRWSKFTGIVNVQPSEPFSSPLNYAHTIEPSCVIIGSRTVLFLLLTTTNAVSLSFSFFSFFDRYNSYLIARSSRIRNWKIQVELAKLERICKIKKLGVPRFFTWQSEREKGKAESLSPHPPLCTFQTRNPRLVSSRRAKSKPRFAYGTSEYLVRCWRTHDRS